MFLVKNDTHTHTLYQEIAHIMHLPRIGKERIHTLFCGFKTIGFLLFLQNNPTNETNLVSIRKSRIFSRAYLWVGCWKGKNIVSTNKRKGQQTKVVGFFIKTRIQWNQPTLPLTSLRPPSPKKQIYTIHKLRSSSSFISLSISIFWRAPSTQYPASSEWALSRNTSGPGLPFTVPTAW